MNISISLNSEQTAALADLVADYNATLNGPPVSEELYLQTVLMGVINDRVAANFNLSAAALVQAAQSASYEKRLELIALVQTTLSEP